MVQSPCCESAASKIHCLYCVLLFSCTLLVSNSHLKQCKKKITLQLGRDVSKQHLVAAQRNLFWAVGRILNDDGECISCFLGYSTQNNERLIIENIDNVCQVAI